jgi:hypothetical protein
MHRPLSVKFVNARQENCTFSLKFISTCRLYRKEHFCIRKIKVINIDYSVFLKLLE